MCQSLLKNFLKNIDILVRMCYNKTIKRTTTHSKEGITMIENFLLNTYTVYDADNNVVTWGQFTDVQEYLDEDGHSIDGYSVVWEYTGNAL